MYYNRNLITAEQHSTDAAEASGFFDLNTQAFSQSQKDWPISHDDFDYALRISVPDSNQVTMTRRTFGLVTYTVDWDDGSSLTTTDEVTERHVYSKSGIYIVKFKRVSGAVLQPQSTNAIVTALFANNNYAMSSYLLSFNEAYSLKVLAMPSGIYANITEFNNAFRLCTSLKKFPLLDVSSGTSFGRTWDGCFNLESFPALSFNSATSLGAAWTRCVNLRTFPVITNTSNVTTFTSAWSGCKSLSSFPLIDTSGGTDFASAWASCSSIISPFPSIDTSNGTTFERAWQSCVSLTSFPALNFTSATQFRSAWQNAYALANFEANMFDSTGTLASNAFFRAFENCSLTAQSIENILTSLVTNGATGIQLHIGGGANAAYSTWSQTAKDALTSLQGRSWTVTYNT